MLCVCRMLNQFREVFRDVPLCVVVTLARQLQPGTTWYWFHHHASSTVNTPPPCQDIWDPSEDPRRPPPAAALTDVYIATCGNAIFIILPAAFPHPPHPSGHLGPLRGPLPAAALRARHRGPGQGGGAEGAARQAGPCALGRAHRGLRHAPGGTEGAVWVSGCG